METNAFFEKDSATFTHLITDPKTRDTAIIDSVLGYDMYSGRTNTQFADSIIEHVNKHELNVVWILETHIHADHITAAHYLQSKLGGKLGIGEHIQDVLSLWVPWFNNAADTPLDGSQFDHLFKDGEQFKIGNLTVTVMHTPGHTPACVSYLVQDAIFVGDTIMMPDLGTTRTDFPAGSPEQMYDSVQKILSLPDETRIFMCHDYPPNDRELSYLSTVKIEKERNILIKAGTSKAAYVKARQDRDKGKPVPKMLLPAIQSNLRAGDFGKPEENQRQYIKIPINLL